MKQLIKEYDYRVKLRTAIWPMVFFGAGVPVLFHEAMTNDRGLIIDGFINIDAGGATIFYYVLSWLAVGFVLLGLVICAAAIFDRNKPKIRLYDDRFEYPAGLFTQKDPANPTAEGGVKYNQVMYSDITFMQILDIYRTRMIEVTAKDKKKHTLVDSRFGAKKELDEVYSFLAGKIQK
jgi:hypothetical protein